MLVQCGVNLAAAKNNSINFFWRSDGVTVFWIWDDPFEVGFARKILDRRAGERVAKERLGKEKNEC